MRFDVITVVSVGVVAAIAFAAWARVIVERGDKGR